MLCLLVAPFVGSFLGVLVRRLPSGRPVLWGRSACEACGRPLPAVELVPVASFVALRGRCAGCGAPIAPMHLAIELAAVAVAGSAALVSDGAELWAGCALGWTMLALAWIDAEHLLLPDVLTLPLVVAGLVAAWWLAPWSVTDRAAGAIAGYLAFRVVEIGYRRWRGRDGLGQGDAKLLAAAGAWLGWPALPWVVVGAALCGLLVAAVLWLRGRRVDAATALPFGPMLAAAAWGVWLLQAGQGS